MNFVRKRDKTIGAKPTSDRLFNTANDLDSMPLPFSGGLKQANLNLHDFLHKDESENKPKRATFTLRPGG